MDRSEWGDDFSAPSGLYRAPWSGSLTSEPLTGRWARFFPKLDVNRAVDYMPSSEIWRHYCEPLTEFVTSVRDVTGVLADMREAMKPNEIEDLADLHSNAAHAGFHMRLAPLAGLVTPAFALGEDFGVDLRWAAPSLGASLVMQLLLDLRGGQQLFTCRNCGTVFSSRVSHARFCSSRCRFTYHKREYRKAQSAKDGEK